MSLSRVLSVASLALTAACASAPPSMNRVLDVSVGMTEAQVESQLGTPATKQGPAWSYEFREGLCTLRFAGGSLSKAPECQKPNARIVAQPLKPVSGEHAHIARAKKQLEDEERALTSPPTAPAVR